MQNDNNWFYSWPCICICSAPTHTHTQIHDFLSIYKLVAHATIDTGKEALNKYWYIGSCYM